MLSKDEIAEMKKQLAYFNERLDEYAKSAFDKKLEKSQEPTEKGNDQAKKMAKAMLRMNFAGK